MSVSKVLPVLVSVAVVVLIAIVQERSRLWAGILGPLPLNALLAFYLVRSAHPDDVAKLAELATGLLIGIVPTIAFIVGAYLLVHRLRFVPLMLSCIGLWAIVFTPIYVLRK